jgi:hypothetical protein
VQRGFGSNAFGQQEPMFIQEASVTYKRCKSKFILCTNCQTSGCPKCEGKLETALELAEKEGILF